MAATTATRALSADAGALSITGQGSTLSVTRALSADAGTLTLTGQGATLLLERRLIASAGALTLSGQAATLFKTSTLPDPADVREGVVYGPGGIYTGTLKAGGQVWLRRR